MRPNRSMPRCTVIPQLAYPDVVEAAAWLCEVFGFSVRIRMGDHRAQLNVGDGAIVLTKREGDAAGSSVMVLSRISTGTTTAPWSADARGQSRQKTFPMARGSTTLWILLGTAGPSRNQLPMWLRRSGVARRSSCTKRVCLFCRTDTYRVGLIARGSCG